MFPMPVARRFRRTRRRPTPRPPPRRTPRRQPRSKDRRPMRLGVEDALVVVDMQYDFLPGGRLAVAGGDEIIKPINQLAEQFQNVIQTQDWHPPDHVSFASNHPDLKPFDVIELPYGPQVLWPDHCVIGTHGAEFSTDLYLPNVQAVIRKGYRDTIDSYSAFKENDHQTGTGLTGY